MVKRPKWRANEAERAAAELCVDSVNERLRTLVGVDSDIVQDAAAEVVAYSLARARAEGWTAGRADMLAKHQAEVETLAKRALDALVAQLRSGDGFSR